MGLTSFASGKRSRLIVSEGEELPSLHRFDGYFKSNGLNFRWYLSGAQVRAAHKRLDRVRGTDQGERLAAYSLCTEEVARPCRHACCHRVRV